MNSDTPKAKTWSDGLGSKELRFMKTFLPLGNGSLQPGKMLAIEGQTQIPFRPERLVLFSSSMSPDAWAVVDLRLQRWDAKEVIPGTSGTKPWSSLLAGNGRIAPPVFSSSAHFPLDIGTMQISDRFQVLFESLMKPEQEIPCLISGVLYGLGIDRNPNPNAEHVVLAQQGELEIILLNVSDEAMRQLQQNPRAFR